MVGVIETDYAGNDGDGSRLQVLLVGKIAVSSHQNLEPISLCREQQFAVFER